MKLLGICDNIWYDKFYTMCFRQVALADVILINKCDLVSPEDVHKLKEKIRLVCGTTNLLGLYYL